MISFVNKHYFYTFQNSSTNIVFDFTEFQVIAFYLLFIGFVGIISARFNLIAVFLSIELVLLGLNIFLICITLSFLTIKFLNIALCLIVLAGAESALGLSILFICNHLFGSINLELFSILKG